MSDENVQHLLDIARRLSSGEEETGSIEQQLLSFARRLSNNNHQPESQQVERIVGQSQPQQVVSSVSQPQRLPQQVASNDQPQPQQVQQRPYFVSQPGFILNGNMQPQVGQISSPNPFCLTTGLAHRSPVVSPTSSINPLLLTPSCSSSSASRQQMVAGGPRFQPKYPQQWKGKWKTKGQRAESNYEFEIEQIILMPSSSPRSATSSEIGRLKRKNLVRDFRKFDTRYSYYQIKEEVKKLFPDHLQDPDLDFFICRKEGKFFNTANLRDGEELGGINLKKFSHNRKLFIIPSKDLNISDDESDDSEPIRKQPYRNRQTPVRFGNYVLNQSGLMSYYDTPLQEGEIDYEVEAANQSVVPDDMKRIKDILEALQPDPSVEPIKIYATRGAIINSGIAFLIDEVDLKNKPLRICFTDLVGIEEEATDWGGPRREFFDQLLDEAVELPIFTGEIEKSVRFDEEHFSKQSYYFVFLLFGLSIVQGGAPPNFLHKDAFQKIIENEELQEENLNKAYEQIKNGLTAVGLLEVMRKEPILFEKLFTLGPSLPSFEEFEALIKFKRSADVNSEDFKVESNIIMLWQRLLLKVRKNQISLSLAHILSFASGTKRPPAIGFDKEIEVTFNHANPAEKFPFGATCGLQIVLPVKVHKLEDFEDFASAMVEGIRNSLGTFGRR